MQEVVVKNINTDINYSFFHQKKAVHQIKAGIWIYLILLVFEGALRKWFLPSLSVPLLVIRDPIAIYIIFLAIYYHLLYWNYYLVGILLISFSSLISSLLVGHGNLYVAIYGLRPLLLHFPLIFIMGNLLTKKDVENIGKAMLWLIPPMTVLMAFQFYSPQSAWVNRGVGGDMAGAGFSGALGYFRPPGTFSFTNGNTLFYGLGACYVFYFWITKNKVSKLLLIAASIGIVAAIPLSISRAYFFQLIVTLAFAGICTLFNLKMLRRGFFVSILLILTFLILSQFNFFQISLEAFATRFNSANTTEGGLNGVIGERYLGSFIRGISSTETQPFWGYGIGMGTNVGSMLLAGDRLFLVAEEEWSRIIGEMGVILGIALLFIRSLLGISLGWSSFLQLKQGNYLAWILLSFGLLQIINAGWAQPTSLGFSIVISGLILASIQDKTRTL